MQIKHIQSAAKLFATQLIYFTSYHRGTTVYSLSNFSQHIKHFETFLWVYVSGKQMQSDLRTLRDVI